MARMLYARKQQIVDPLSPSLFVQNNVEVSSSAEDESMHQGDVAVPRHSKQRKRTGVQHDCQYPGVLVCASSCSCRL
jgi:hypothetical protein